jgi:PPM family protein phosphatase
MRINFSARTETGIVRTENQDCYGLIKQAGFYFVCDGMGGSVAGGFASSVARDVILKSYQLLTEADTKLLIENPPEGFNHKELLPIASIRLANRALYTYAEKNQKLSGMGTTVSAVLFDETRDLVYIY